MTTLDAKRTKRERQKRVEEDNLSGQHVVNRFLQVPELCRDILILTGRRLDSSRTPPTSCSAAARRRHKHLPSAHALLTTTTTAEEEEDEVAAVECKDKAHIIA